ncbi:hypothetical protein HELRODRAFT_191389 [Helobdella robusta]|uniref:C1q domain-containing protein n=1 Tax=Helobdella robusta TaxID=6412 RepID=T1FSY3_HELRO|nr:hypothetical protein HELRODRAFT_191389 [Helobdella robusta]ESO05162.1 hypothetical protein HELRODRAFT_191389 [Helobdella robusta]
MHSIICKLAVFVVLSSLAFQIGATSTDRNRSIKAPAHESTSKHKQNEKPTKIRAFSDDANSSIHSKPSDPVQVKTKNDSQNDEKSEQNSNQRQKNDHAKNMEMYQCIGLPGHPGVPGIQGIQGVPGVQGVQGLNGNPGINGRPGQKGEQGRRGHKGEKGDSGQMPLSDHSMISENKLQPKVAFSVTTEEHIDNSSDYRVVKFNIVHTNVGGHYDVATGKFTAPENGTYLIGMNGVSFDGQHVLLHLNQNGKRMFSAFDSSGCSCCDNRDPTLRQREGEFRCSGSASNTGILLLERGDKVWVQLSKGYGLHNVPYHNYASFYGYFLFSV